MNKYWFCFAFIAFLSVVTSTEYFSEEECNKVGGICQDKDDCPEGYSPGIGLCPKQQDQNVECCNKLPDTECAASGGICRNSCPSSITQNANDCPKPLVCCTLV